jgi:hydrogenase expression/formation protein HypD
MKYIDEFRDRKLVSALAAKIRVAAGLAPRECVIMEVCGTHTMSVFKFGLRDLLPANVRLVSGPGCPVCVTPNSFLDKAIALARLKGVAIATFGDMMRVPGSWSSLMEAKAFGCDIRVVYSSTDALDIARKNRRKDVIFLGVGFETTVPTVASSIIAAKDEGITNYSVLCAHKTMPAALRVLAAARDMHVDGFLLPGHVSVIIGSRPYEFLSRRYGKRCAIAGFEPTDILEAIYLILSQKKPKVDVEYSRLITKDGNKSARKGIAKVFEEADAEWRGIGNVKGSGLAIRKGFSAFDADKRFDIRVASAKEDKRCMCGDVLKGVKTPLECRLFGRACTPEHPVGACMVSSEGTCAAYYKYGVGRRVKGAG